MPFWHLEQLGDKLPMYSMFKLLCCPVTQTFSDNQEPHLLCLIVNREVVFLFDENPLVGNLSILTFRLLVAMTNSYM